MHKLEAGRILDIADCEQLVEINYDTLDNDYLDRWADQLGLRQALEEVRVRVTRKKE